MYVAWLLLFPTGYAILCVLLAVVTIILVGFGSYTVAAVINILIGIAIFVLFYMNWKIMRERDPKGAYSQL